MYGKIRIEHGWGMWRYVWYIARAFFARRNLVIYGVKTEVEDEQ